MPVVAALLLVAGCTSGGSGSQHTTRPTSPTPTVTGTAPTAPASVQPTSPVAVTCSRSSTKLTYRRHAVVVAAHELDVAAGSKITSPRHLAVVTLVVARAHGLGTGSGLPALVAHHWHTTAAPLGQTTKTLDTSSTVTVSGHKHGTKNEAFVLYRFTPVYSGTFDSVCGGKDVRGHYTTFGPITNVLITCHGGHPTRLDKRARAVGCF